MSKHQEKEDVDNNFKVLQEKHGKDKQFTTSLLHLWAKMISAGLHNDFDSSPDLPAFSQSQSKKPHKQKSLILLARLPCLLFMLYRLGRRERNKTPSLKVLVYFLENLLNYG